MGLIKIDIPLLNSLLTLATVIEARDAYTGGHTWRVGEYSRLLAEKAGLSHDEVFVSHLGGLVHDLGKIGISDSVLNKMGKLTDEEYALLKRHPEVGQEIAASHPLAPVVLDAIADHHERVDGLGYPNRRQGDEITVIARIISIADAFDAMTSSRPYRRAMPAEEALKIIREERGKQFDAGLADLFVEIGEKQGFGGIIQHYGEAKPMLVCPSCGPVVTASSHQHDGDQVICPACKGQFRLHSAGQTFMLEWLQTEDYTLVPKPDYDVINEFVKKAPEKVKIDNWELKVG